jgi:hypothetical protein
MTEDALRHPASLGEALESEATYFNYLCPKVQIFVAISVRYESYELDRGLLGCGQAKRTKPLLLTVQITMPASMKILFSLVLVLMRGWLTHAVCRLEFVIRWSLLILFV